MRVPSFPNCLSLLSDVNVSLRVALQNKGTHLPLPLETQKVDRS